MMTDDETRCGQCGAARADDCACNTTPPTPVAGEVTREDLAQAHRMANALDLVARSAGFESSKEATMIRRLIAALTSGGTDAE